MEIPFSGCLFLQGTSTPQPHYILWHEPNNAPSAAALAQLNSALCANPQYHYAQQIGQLSALTAQPHPNLLAYASQHAPSRIIGTRIKPNEIASPSRANWVCLMRKKARFS